MFNLHFVHILRCIRELLEGMNRYLLRKISYHLHVESTLWIELQLTHIGCIVICVLSIKRDIRYKMRLLLAFHLKDGAWR